MKVWTLSGTEHSSLEPVYENESKPIRCLNAVQLVCCRYNQRTLLIVCAKYWQVIDSCSIMNRISSTFLEFRSMMLATLHCCARLTIGTENDGRLGISYLRILWRFVPMLGKHIAINFLSSKPTNPSDASLFFSNKTNIFL